MILPGLNFLAFGRANISSYIARTTAESSKKVWKPILAVVPVFGVFARPTKRTTCRATNGMTFYGIP
jgi:hypothetical protein